MSRHAGEDHYYPINAVDERINQAHTFGKHLGAGTSNTLKRDTVEMAMDANCEAIGHLEKRLYELEMRLGPVLSCDDEAGPRTEVLSPMNERIEPTNIRQRARDLSNRIGAADLRIATLMRRLELGA